MIRWTNIQFGCLSKSHSVRYGCDYHDNDKDISWYILMGLKKRNYNLFFLDWTSCESIKQFTFIFTLLLQIWLGEGCQNWSYYERWFCHKGDFPTTLYELIGLSMAFFVRWVIWSIVDMVQGALYPLGGSSSGSDSLSSPNQDAFRAANSLEWTGMKRLVL